MENHLQIQGQLGFFTVQILGKDDKDKINPISSVSAVLTAASAARH